MEIGSEKLFNEDLGYTLKIETNVSRLINFTPVFEFKQNIFDHFGKLNLKKNTKKN